MKHTPIFCTVDQGSLDWFQVRLGIPTASRFKEILTDTGARRKGTMPDSYRNELLAERLTGKPADKPWSAIRAMERGKELEPCARAWYEIATGQEVHEVGFAMPEMHYARVGASPDGICADRGLEIKCPLGKQMINLLLLSEKEAAAEYLLQCQAGMWITGLFRWDLVFYTDEPKFPNRIITLSADEELHKAFETHIIAFCNELDEAEQKIIELAA